MLRLLISRSLSPFEAQSFLTSDDSQTPMIVYGKIVKGLLLVDRGEPLVAAMMSTGCVSQTQARPGSRHKRAAELPPMAPQSEGQDPLWPSYQRVGSCLVCGPGPGQSQRTR